MKRFLLLLITTLYLLPAELHAAPRDSLFVVWNADGWSLMQRVTNGETSGSFTRRFHVPATMLTAANGMAGNDRPVPGSLVSIPLGPYNFLSAAPQTMSEARPLYYRMSANDRMRAIARRAGVSADELATRNGLGKDEPLPGRVLLVGWVRYDATPLGSNMHPDDPLPRGMRVIQDTPKNMVISTPVAADTLSHVDAPKAPSSLSQFYKEQTSDGRNIVTERGSAGFFPLTKGAAGAAVYAFHNTASKGSVMIVRNLNNGKAIYVKILGPLPQTKAFAGCIIGLSNQAKLALGVRENKAFCELTYAGY